MSEDFGEKSGPALLEPEDELGTLESMTGLAAEALDLASHESTDYATCWEVFQKLERALQERASHPEKIPGEDEAYIAYRELAEHLNLKETDLHVKLNNQGHITLN